MHHTYGVCVCTSKMAVFVCVKEEDKNVGASRVFGFDATGQQVVDCLALYIWLFLVGTHKESARTTFRSIRYIIRCTMLYSQQL